MKDRLPSRLEVGWELARASLLVLVSSDQRSLARLGQPVDTADEDPGAGQSVVVLLGRRVAAAARRLPWRPACLPQAMAAQRLLHRRGLAQEVHVALDPSGRLRAHAWVTSQGRPVVGGDGTGFTRIATLSLPRRTRSSA